MLGHFDVILFTTIKFSVNNSLKVLREFNSKYALNKEMPPQK